MPIKPLIFEIPYQNAPAIYAAFSEKPWAFFLDSAATDQGRYSYIAIDPFLTLTSKNELITESGRSFTGDPFTHLQKKLKAYVLDPEDAVLPFQGGAVGYFGYELYQHIEKKVPSPKKDDLDFPDLAIGFYDLIIGFDHLKQHAYVCSSGFPEIQPEKRIKRAQQRFESLYLKPVTQSARLPQHYPITSNVTQSIYQASVKTILDHINNGDIYQANFSQRFECEIKENPYSLYCALRTSNPAPYAAYLSLGDLVIASASPECLITLQNQHVLSSPIKGTRKRSSDQAQDQALAKELFESEKDRAENLMIVDLVRNDLSKVCDPHSVHVAKLFELNTFATLHHLISHITAHLLSQYDAIDLLKSLFPAGSVTGAPKVRAMEIIHELEPQPRGPYCGSIGYIGFDGNMQLSVTIRTYCIQSNRVTFHAGGGIVADSDPEKEYQESNLKAEALRRNI